MYGVLPWVENIFVVLPGGVAPWTPRRGTCRLTDPSAPWRASALKPLARSGGRRAGSGGRRSQLGYSIIRYSVV